MPRRPRHLRMLIPSLARSSSEGSGARLMAWPSWLDWPTPSRLRRRNCHLHSGRVASASLREVGMGKRSPLPTPSRSCPIVEAVCRAQVHLYRPDSARPGRQVLSGSGQRVGGIAEGCVRTDRLAAKSLGDSRWFGRTYLKAAVLHVPSRPPPVALWPPSHPSQQLPWLYFDGAGKFDDRVQAGQPQTTLKEADLGYVQPGSLRGHSL